MAKTEEQIWVEANRTTVTALGERRKINHILRSEDESHLWPIQNRFNVTERAIRRVCRYEREAGMLSGLEYIYAVSAEIGQIVNGEV